MGLAPCQSEVVTEQEEENGLGSEEKEIMPSCVKQLKLTLVVNRLGEKIIKYG